MNKRQPLDVRFSDGIYANYVIVNIYRNHYDCKCYKIIIRMLLGKSNIHCVFWNEFTFLSCIVSQ